MLYVFVALLGVIAGAVSVFALLDIRRRSVQEQKRRLDGEAKQVHESLSEIKAKEQELGQQAGRLKAKQAEIEARVVSYRELQDENAILKRDLQNIDVNLRKVRLDRMLQGRTQETLDQRSKDLGCRR